MKKEILKGILNLFKVKSISTFVCLYIFYKLAVSDRLEMATTVAILMMVFQSLFGKGKDEK